MAATLNAPVSVGLAGSGDWAFRVHGPVFAEGPQTRLVGVWSRNRGSAEDLARAYDCQVFAEFEELLQVSELVSFAVAPDAQPRLARQAALAGRHVLLEKPIASCLRDAVELADVLAERRVESVLFLTYRFSPMVESFMDSCKRRTPLGARLRFLTTTRPEEVDGWRRERGLLLDLGFHVFDLLDASVGRIRSIMARGDAWRSVSLGVHHLDESFSEATVSWAGCRERRTELVVRTREGNLVLDPSACVRGPWLPRQIRDAVWSAVRGRRGRAAGIERGVYLQRCVQAAEQSLGRPGELVEVG